MYCHLRNLGLSGRQGQARLSRVFALSQLSLRAVAVQHAQDHLKSRPGVKQLKAFQSNQQIDTQGALEDTESGSRRARVSQPRNVTVKALCMYQDPKDALLEIRMAPTVWEVSMGDVAIFKRHHQVSSSFLTNPPQRFVRRGVARLCQGPSPLQHVSI